jgi:hypothetical protein
MTIIRRKYHNRLMFMHEVFIFITVIFRYNSLHLIFAVRLIGNATPPPPDIATLSLTSGLPQPTCDEKDPVVTHAKSTGKSSCKYIGCRFI